MTHQAVKESAFLSNEDFLGSCSLGTSQDKARDCTGGNGLWHGFVRAERALTVHRSTSLIANHSSRCNTQQHKVTAKQIKCWSKKAGDLRRPPSRCTVLPFIPSCAIKPSPLQTQTKPHVSFSFWEQTTLKMFHCATEATLHSGYLKLHALCPQ